MSDNNRVRDTGSAFMPKFGADGLLTAVVVHADTRAPLMLAHMNEEALKLTRGTNFAHFYSRSRKALWKKGETSGNVLSVKRILVDCDQDALILECEPVGPACHTGATSCFYRELSGEGLIPISS